MYLINTVLQLPKNIQQVQISKQSITAAMEIFLSISIAEHHQQILPDANIGLQVFRGEFFVLKVSSKHIGFRQPKPVGSFQKKKRDILNEIHPEHQNHKMFCSFCFLFFFKIT